MEKVMPESIKYYPVVAQLVSFLGEHRLTTFHAAIISAQNQEDLASRVMQRLVIGYRGPHDACGNNEEYKEMYRGHYRRYLQNKARTEKRFKDRILEPIVEIEIDLRGVTPTLMTT